MLTDKLGNYFSLGFESKSVGTPAPNVPLMLGKKHPSRREELLWEIACWLLLTLGVFLRKAIVIATLGWDRGNLTLGAFLASAVIALAVFPPFMKWFNHRRPGASLGNFATAFAFGFFLDLASVAAHKIAPGWLG
jgi:hypothetical protein